MVHEYGIKRGGTISVAELHVAELHVAKPNVSKPNVSKPVNKPKKGKGS